MKLALIFLSIFVAVSHQQYYLNPRMMFAFPWLAAPFSYERGYLHDRYNYQLNEYNYPPQNIFDTEVEDEFSDTQSRIKGIYRPLPSFQDQQNARFPFNLFATTTFNNPLLKTATFTSTQTLSLVKIVNCVPANQFAVAAPAACRRKRNDDDTENHQFTIAPSETLSVMPTALPSSHDRSSMKFLSSSKDDTGDGMSPPAHFSRDKRFFKNRNRFVVISTLTTFAFVNTTQTVTVNLLNPVPGVGAPALCVPVPANPGDPNGTPAVPSTPAQPCVNCLPAGYNVCPAVLVVRI